VTTVIAAATNDSRPLTHRAVLAMSIPIILSNLTTPIVGALGTGVIGQLGEPATLGGVAISVELFNLLFWSFGFLRLSTSGLTAQAKGAGDGAEIAATLERALLVAVVLGMLMILIQQPLAVISLRLMGGSAEIQTSVHSYFIWRIWSAPFAFVNYAFLGWFIGLGLAGRALALQLALSLVTLAASVILVLMLHWSAAGAGAAVLIAEAACSLVAATLAWREIRSRGGRATRTQVLAAAPLKRLFAINANIMVRNLCLTFTFATVAALGARNGDLAAAANGILLDLFAITSNFLDGFANAAETFVGQAIGARQRQRLIDAIRITSQWAGVLSLLAAAVVWQFGGLAIDAMSTSPEVRAATREFLPWCALTPLAGVVAFQLDGFFIGATRGADLRNTMLVSLAFFLAAVALLVPRFGNHGLWLALILYFLVRGLTLGSRLPALLRDAVAQPASTPAR
jgi:multidrug resistance protein, MATE family